MSKNFKIAIVGAGPGGMSAAARAAELGVSHVLLEAAPHIANTIFRYPKRKELMSEPKQLPLRSTLRFCAGTREEILAVWQQDMAKLGVVLRMGAAVASISGQRGDFVITLSTGETLSAEFVVLAIGLQGNICKLNVPGDELSGVQYHLADREEFKGETIVVVGGGDAAVEDALALAKQNRVLLTSIDEFNGCKKANYDLMMAAVARGRLEIRPGSRVERVEAHAGGACPLGIAMQTPQGLEQIQCHRVIARLGANPPRRLVESFGVRFQDSDAASVPQLSERYESNVPGLYVIGALAGYPLIKQAMNQGYETVEYILGNAVEPADEALLRGKLAGLPNISSVADGIELIRSNQPLLASLTTLQLREFMLDSSTCALHAGEVIFRKNDPSTSFFSIIRGKVDVHMKGVDGAPTMITLGAGEFFGELGLLSGRRRSATAIAGDGCVLIETPGRSLLKLLEASSSVQRRLDEVSIKRVLRNSLHAALSEAELEHVAQEAKIRHYAVGDALFKEGDAPDGLYLIRRGSVTVSRVIAGKDVVLAYLAAGNYVGETALESNTPRTVTVRAASPTTVALLEAERVRAVMKSNAAVRNNISGSYVERVHLNEHGLSGGFVKFLIEQGIGEATDVLLIDYSKCIRCNNCEAACAAAHDGTSRLDREAGPTYEQVHVPASCRHCEHPHCMKDCPADAIHRSGNGEVLIEDSCIGCGNCRNNCPYGVIQMAAQRPAGPPGILRRIFGRAEPRRESSETAEAAPKKAVKCDMCKGILGVTACVRACPTGAAFRVSPEIYFESRVPS